MNTGVPDIQDRVEGWIPEAFETPTIGPGLQALAAGRSLEA